VKIDVICPSRERPDRCREMADSVMSTATGRVNVLVGVDADDPRLDEYKKLDWITLYIVDRERRGCAKIANNIAMHSTADVVQFLGDDCLMLTEGWDEMIADSVPADGIALISLMNKEHETRKQAYHPAITRKWIDAVGWYTLPGAFHYGIDTTWINMAKAINRLIWVEGAVIEHRHYKRGANPIVKDSVYDVSEALISSDSKNTKAMKDEIDLAISKLRKAMA
jgi:hypothetical protein